MTWVSCLIASGVCLTLTSQDQPIPKPTGPRHKMMATVRSANPEHISRFFAAFVDETLPGFSDHDRF